MLNPLDENPPPLVPQSPPLLPERIVWLKLGNAEFAAKTPPPLAAVFSLMVVNCELKPAEQQKTPRDTPPPLVPAEFCARVVLMAEALPLEIRRPPPVPPAVLPTIALF